MEISVDLMGWGWTYDELKKACTEFDDLGFDGCYIGDDLFPHYWEEDPASAVPEIEVYDPWTLLPIIAELTTLIRIGTMVTPGGRRHPALFAKMTTLVDIIAGGRRTAGLSASNAPDQRSAVGDLKLNLTERVARLGEEVRILDSLWRNERTTFKGTYYSVESLISYPKPVSQPRPELLFGFKSKKYMTRLAAEFAD
ncbi:MAG: LLM class flavin-dependent oxidoreductase [Myxococcales bacterium]